ncbi:MAG: dihydrolipoyl dehydrogenase [Alphaproteobacteria bacterium]|nr:dihydrolipoyl dehydrogenase [Alphaproteobacteria bacterium]
MTENTFDLVVIGGGPGGYVAAIRASQLGMRTALVEASHLGGVCLNWGCIPTKALLRSAEVHRLVRHADRYGLKVSGLEVDFTKVIERSRAVSKQLSQGVKGLLRKNKVSIIDGWGKLAGKGRITVEVDGKVTQNLSAKHIVLATGARARVLPGLEPDGKVVWTYKEAMVPDAMPKSLLVVGSGAIGTEFASFYNDLGARVTLVEVVDRILPVEDEEISTMARKAFEAQGVKILTGATVTKLEKSKSNVKATIRASDGKEEQHVFDRAIMAVGIVANTDNIGLENTKVKLERGQIVTDEWLQTGESGIYAIGDVAGAPWLAHKASHEGVICVEKLAGVGDVHPLDKRNIPGCTYSHPQIASVGLTERAAKEAGYEVRVGRFPFIGNGKAIALGEPDGLVKTVFDARTGELLGAHMIGAEVTELVQGFGIARTLEATEAELMHTVFPHPTLSEMMHESVLDAYGRAIHY